MMAQKTIPNWVEVGTLIVAIVTLIISGIAASFAWRLDNVERQLLEFQASSEILHRLIVVPAFGSCALENRLRVQKNDIWLGFQTNNCLGNSENPDELRVAGLSIELSSIENPVFVPRPNLSVGTVASTTGQQIDQISFSGDTTVQSLGFVEDGDTAGLFIPLAVVDDNGVVVSNKVIWPASMSWQSPVTGQQIDVQLSWFSPRDQWQSYDGILWAQ